MVTNGVVMPVPSPDRSNKTKIIKPLTVSVAEACELIGVGRTTMWVLIRSGRLKTLSIGRRRLIVFESLQELVAGTRAGS